jgi:hypothetical protein
VRVGEKIGDEQRIPLDQVGERICVHSLILHQSRLYTYPSYLTFDRQRKPGWELYSNQSHSETNLPHLT